MITITPKLASKHRKEWTLIESPYVRNKWTTLQTPPHRRVKTSLAPTSLILLILSCNSFTKSVASLNWSSKLVSGMPPKHLHEMLAVRNRKTTQKLFMAMDKFLKVAIAGSLCPAADWIMFFGWLISPRNGAPFLGLFASVRCGVTSWLSNWSILIEKRYQSFVNSLGNSAWVCLAALTFLSIFG